MTEAYIVLRRTLAAAQRRLLVSIPPTSLQQCWMLWSSALISTCPDEDVTWLCRPGREQSSNIARNACVPRGCRERSGCLHRRQCGSRTGAAFRRAGRPEWHQTWSSLPASST